MEELRDRVLKLHRKGVSPKEVQRRLLGFEDRMCYITSGHVSKQNVIDSILAEDDKRMSRGILSSHVCSTI